MSIWYVRVSRQVDSQERGGRGVRIEQMKASVHTWSAVLVASCCCSGSGLADSDATYLDLSAPFSHYAIAEVTNIDDGTAVSGLLIGTQGFILTPDLPEAHNSPRKAYSVLLRNGSSINATSQDCSAGACLLWTDPQYLEEIYTKLKDAGGVQFNCDSIEIGPITIIGEFYEEGYPLVVVVPDSIIGSRGALNNFFLSQALLPRLKGSVVIGGDGTVVGIVAQTATVETPYSKLIPTSSIKSLLNTAKVECETNNERIRRTVKLGDAKLDQKRYDEARKLFESALESASDNSDKWKPLYRLAEIEYNDRNYDKSYADAVAAFRASDDYTLLLAAAEAQKAANNFQGALGTYDTVITGIQSGIVKGAQSGTNKGSTDPNLIESLNTAIYERGRIRLLIQTLLQTHNPSQAELSNSESDFDIFITRGGQPQHFAYYHLACINAMAGRVRQAEENLQTSINLLDQFNSNDATQQRLYLYNALNGYASGDTLVRCAKLQAIVKDRFKTFAGLFPNDSSGGIVPGRLY
jgi:tetratricopeptide (TPR) repeat protein